MEQIIIDQLKHAGEYIIPQHWSGYQTHLCQTISTTDCWCEICTKASDLSKASEQNTAYKSAFVRVQQRFPERQCDKCGKMGTPIWLKQHVHPCPDCQLDISSDISNHKCSVRTVFTLGCKIEITHDQVGQHVQDCHRCYRMLFTTYNPRLVRDVRILL